MIIDPTSHSDQIGQKLQPNPQNPQIDKTHQLALDEFNSLMQSDKEYTDEELFSISPPPIKVGEVAKKAEKVGVQNLGGIDPDLEIECEEVNPIQEEDLFGQPASVAPIPPVPAPAAASPAPISLQEIQKMAAECQKNNANESTQTILSKMMKKIGNGYTIDSQLATKEGQYHLETFTHQSGELYYKIDVTYTIRMKINGKNQKFSLNRTIFTAATTPEEAIFVASKFKNMVVELALSTADSAYQTSLNGDYKQVMNVRSFNFHFEYHSPHKPASIKSIQATDASQKLLTLNMNSNSPNKYFYNAKGRLQQVKNPEEEQELILAGEKLFSSEDHALSDAPYAVKDEDQYDRLAKKNSLLQHIESIHQDIAKKEKEFDEVKALFIKKPWMKWWKNEESDTEGFQQYLANLKAKKDKQLTLKKGELSSNMVNYLSKSEKLTAYKSKRGFQQLVTIAQLKDLLNKNKEIDENLISAEDLKALDTIVNTMISKYSKDKMTTLKAKLDPLHFGDKIAECLKIQESQQAYIEDLEKEISQLKKKIEGEQQLFNSHYKKLLKLQSDLSQQIEKLKTLKNKAIEIHSAQGTSEDHLKTSQQVIQAISKNLDKIQQQDSENVKLIKKLKKNLEEVSEKGGTDQSEGVDEADLDQDFIMSPEIEQLDDSTL